MPASGVGEPGSSLRSLAIDGHGRGVAAWERFSAGRTTVQIGEETSPGAWTAGEPMAGANSAPIVAASSDGSALVTWVRGKEGVFVTERSSSGSFRDVPTPFASGGVEPFVVTASAGESFLTWCAPTASGWGVAVARRAPGASVWERPSDGENVVSPPILYANQPRLAVNARGDAVLAWYQSEGVPLMTYVSERAPEGAFSRPGTRDFVSPPGAAVASDPIANPKPAVAPDGEAAVAWTQANGRGATPVYLATRNARGTWTKPLDLADAFSETATIARGVQVAFAPDGELFIAWIQDGAVYAARRGRDGAWIDRGNAPARLSSVSRTAFGLALAAGGRGSVVATWVESEGPHEQRCVARRTGASRATWLPVEWLSPEHGGDVGAPAVAIGKDDRVIVGWAAGAPGAMQIVFASVE